MEPRDRRGGAPGVLAGVSVGGAVHRPVPFGFGGQARSAKRGVGTRLGEADVHRPRRHQRELVAIDPLPPHGAPPSPACRRFEGVSLAPGPAFVRPEPAIAVPASLDEAQPIAVGGLACLDSKAADLGVVAFELIAPAKRALGAAPAQRDRPRCDLEPPLRWSGVFVEQRPRERAKAVAQLLEQIRERLDVHEAVLDERHRLEGAQVLAAVIDLRTRGGRPGANRFERRPITGLVGWCAFERVDAKGEEVLEGSVERGRSND